MGAVKLWNFEVSHPDYGTVVVPSIGPDSATLAATQAWGVPEKWGRIAGYCTVRKLGTAIRPRCRRCGDEYGQPGEKSGGLCPTCERTARLYSREKAVRIKSQDRRPGYRERERSSTW